MRKLRLLSVLALCACPEKAVAPTPAPAPPPKPAAPRDAGPQEQSHLRPAPTGGEVKKLPDGTLLLKGHTEALLAVAYDPSGKRVATGGLDRSVRLWDLQTEKLLWAAGPSDEAVTALAFDPKGELVAAGDRAFQVRLYKTSDGSMAQQRPHPDAISSMSFSPDGKWLAVAGSSGNAEVYPTGSEGPSKCELRGRTVDFTDDGKYVVTATASAVLAVTAFPSCKKVKETSTGSHLPFAAASARASLVGTRNGNEPIVMLWDALQGRMLGKLDRQTGGVSALQLSADGKRALVASDDRHVRLYDIEKAELLKTVDTNALPFAAMSPDASKAVIADGIDARVVSLTPSPP